MTCIIVDDEPLAREEMQSLIQEVSQIEILGKFPNAIAALDFLKVKDVDLIFLDIEMPMVTGLEFAEQIENKIRKRGAGRSLQDLNIQYRSWYRLAPRRQVVS